MAATWFIATNAILVIEGDYPNDLRLPLPNGPQPEHATVTSRPVVRPSAVTVNGPACDLNLIMPAEPAALARG